MTVLPGRLTFGRGGKDGCRAWEKLRFAAAAAQERLASLDEPGEKSRTDSGIWPSSSFESVMTSLRALL